MSSIWNYAMNVKAARVVKAGVCRIRDDARRKPSILLIACVAGAAASFVFGIAVAAIWTVFILFLSYGWDMSIPIVVGIFSLLLCTLFAFTGKIASAEAAAVYAYFFLGIAGILWFVRYGHTLI